MAFVYCCVCECICVSPPSVFPSIFILFPPLLCLQVYKTKRQQPKSKQARVRDASICLLQIYSSKYATAAGFYFIYLFDSRCWIVEDEQKSLCRFVGIINTEFYMFEFHIQWLIFLELLHDEHFLLQNSMKWIICAYACILSTLSKIGLSQKSVSHERQTQRGKIQKERTLVRKFRELAIFQMWNKTEGNKSMFFLLCVLFRFCESNILFIYFLFGRWCFERVRLFSLLHILRINLHFYNRIFSRLFFY